MAFETENWYYKPARHFGVKRSKASVRHIIIHSAETPMTNGAARRIQDYFAGPSSAVASSHIMVDNKEIVQCVYDSYVAYAAPGANHDGIQIEQAGYAKYTRSEWLSKYGMDQLNLTARVVAQYSLKYNIPIVELSVKDLQANRKGIATHDTVSKAFKQSSHWDPGPNYPMDLLLALSSDYRDRYSGNAAPKPPVDDPLPPVDYEVVVTYRAEAERTAAHALGHAHTFRVLPHDHDFFVGIEVALGYESDHKYRRNYVGKNAKETGQIVADLIRNKSWAKKLRAEGKAIAAKRKKGEETHG